MRVLIGEVSSYKAIVICSYLNAHYPGLEIFTYDFRNFTRTFHTTFSHKHFVLSNTSLEKYIEEIAALVNKEKIDLFLPVHSDFIEPILARRHLFGNSLDYLGSIEHYLSLHNKRSMWDLASAAGVPVPAQYQNEADAKMPYVVKPLALSSSKGVRYVFGQSERGTVTNKTHVIQEYIRGAGCGYSAYVRNGVIEDGYAHIRIAEYPASGGSSVYRSGFESPEIKSLAEKILARVPFTGFIMFEFKSLSDGSLVLIEINPRIWGSINQGLRNGTNYFRTLLALPFMDIQPKPGVNTYLSPQVYVSLILNCLRGNFSPLRFFIANWKNNSPDVSFYKDFLGWCSTVLRFFLK